MPIFKTIAASVMTEQPVDTFGGYNHNLKIGDGEFYDMLNMSSDFYPLLGNRTQRSIIMPGGKRFTAIYGMTMDGAGNLFVVGKYDTATDVTLYKIYRDDVSGTYQKILNVSLNARRKPSFYEENLSLSEGAKQLIVFGNYLLIFPDKISIDLKEYIYGDSTEASFYYKKLEYEYSTTLSTSFVITLTPCDADGNELSGTASTTAPSSPNEGTIWVDTSGPSVVWKKYTSTQWIVISDVYVGVSVPYTFHTLAEVDIQDGDAVKFMGIGDLDGTHIIIKKAHSRDETDLRPIFVINGVIKEKAEITSGTFTMSRKIPAMDYIVQCQNRLWGCRYHEAESSDDESINEIYACKLGDPSNWNVFQGISTDSYAASCGTTGAFTGAVNVNGYPVFFKENCYHKVHLSSTGAHQIIDKPCSGVQSGCSGSVVVVGDICYYKSRGGIMAFDGSQAYNIGSALGDIKYTKADGGCANTKYYLSLKDTAGKWSIFAYDTEKGLWYKEDNEHALMFCSMNNDTVYAIEKTGAYDIKLISNYTTTANLELPQGWEAITGLQGYGYTGQKYISRFNLRMMLPKGSSMDIYIEYDSSGRWEPQGHIKGTGTTTFMLPVKPRRCDHFRIKLKGIGDVRIYSFSKLFEGGTDIK